MLDPFGSVGLPHKHREQDTTGLNNPAMIHQACQAGLAVETPEQIQAALGRILESIEREARSDE